MIKIWIAILISLFITSLALSQELSSKLNLLQKSFDNFEYGKVILMADSLLSHKKNFSEADLQEIYRMKGISQYSLLKKGEARKSFIEILKINHNYTLDPLKTSPKIVSFFNGIKTDINQIQEKNNQTVRTKTDTIYIAEVVPDLEGEINLKQSILRSAILPGWGQLYNDEVTKGTIITAAGALSLASMIYFIIDSNKKEKNYLSATQPSDIAFKYNAFNRSYHFRNISIIIFAAVWIYSQIDLIFFSNPRTSLKTVTKKMPGVSYEPSKGITFDFKIYF